MMTPAKPKKTRRVFPPAVKIYVPDKKYAEELEKDAKRYNLSVSQLCLMALNIGMPEVKRHMDEIVVKSL